MATKKSSASNSPNKKNIPVSDVAQPGEVKPSTGSRPIIVGHKAKIQQDPMVKQSNSSPAAEKAPAEDQQPIVPPSEKKEKILSPDNDTSATVDAPAVDDDEIPAEKILKIKPSKKTDTTDFDPKDVLPPDAMDETKDTPEEKEDIKSEKADSKEEPAVDEDKAEPSPDTDNQSAKSTADETLSNSEPATEEDSADTNDTQSNDQDNETNGNEEAVSDDASTTETEESAIKDPNEAPSTSSAVQEPEGGLVDELAQQAATKKQQKQADKQETVREEKIMALVNDKTYFVPIRQRAKRRAKHVVWLLIFLILVLVGLNFALDAELLDLGVQPLTNVL